MNNSTSMKNIDHEDDGYVKEEAQEPNEQIHDNPNEADDDYAIEEDESLDNFGMVDMAEVFPKTDDNPIEYIYTRDSTGRVVSVDFRLKVPRNEVDFIRSHDEKGVIIDVECRFKETGGEDKTKEVLGAGHE